jgi:5-methylcytosine-specific restriction enzyme A
MTRKAPRLRMARPLVRTVDIGCIKTPARMNDEFYRSPEWRALVWEILAERGRRCERAGCGRTDGRMVVDHIEPLSQGGAALDRSNLQVLCHPCHQGKGAASRQGSDWR